MPNTGRACASPMPRASCAATASAAPRRESGCAGRYGIPYGRDARRDARHLPRRPARRAGLRLHPRRLLAPFPPATTASSASARSLSASRPSSIDYSLCPKVTIDEITRQCRAAVAWTLRHIGAAWRRPGARRGRRPFRRRPPERDVPHDALGRGLRPGARSARRGAAGERHLRHRAAAPQLPAADDPARRRHRPAQLADVRRAAVRDAGARDLGWRGERGVRAPVDLVPRRVAGGGQPLELLAQPGANHFSAIHGFADPDHRLCRWLAERLLTSP